MNAALAMIEAAAPQNKIEGALAIQMACTHTAAISVLARFGGGGASNARGPPSSQRAVSPVRLCSQGTFTDADVREDRTGPQRGRGAVRFPPMVTYWDQAPAGDPIL
jgi:hypothetical protein